MSKKRSANWYKEHFGPHRMRERPLEIPDAYIAAEISSDGKRPVLLVSVNNAHRVPKCLVFPVQFMMPGWEPDVNNWVLLGNDGCIHYVQPRNSQEAHR